MKPTSDDREHESDRSNRGRLGSTRILTHRRENASQVDDGEPITTLARVEVRRDNLPVHLVGPDLTRVHVDANGG